MRHSNRNVHGPRGSVLLGLLGVLLAVPVRATTVTSIGLNITGSTYQVDSFTVPADADGVAGPNHFVEFINGRYSVYNKVSGVREQTMTDKAYWSRAGITLFSGWDLADPRIIYDPSVQRWFASQVDFDPTGAINTNRFLLAVSASADPTGAWKGVAIPGNPGGNNFADFPTLGLDTQGVYLAADLFDPNGNDIGSSLWSISKAPLLGPTPDITGRTSFGVLSYTSRGYILQPAVCLDGGAGGIILSTEGLGYDFNIGDFITNTALLTFAIENPIGPGAATLSALVSLAVPGYTAPVNPTQPDGSSNLDDGDARLSAAVRRVGDVLYAVHGTQANGRAAIRWYRIHAVSHAVLEAGTIADSHLDLFYPSIAANANGTVVVGCNGCSSNVFVSCYAVTGETVNGVTTFGELLLLKAGAASYQDGSSGGFSRWGDYSATCVDPADPSRFWTTQMYPSSASAWSTQITELLTSPLRLGITQAGGNVVISWSKLATGFQLQSTSSLSPGNVWLPVNQTPATNGSLVSVTLPASGDQQFFRLIR